MTTVQIAHEVDDAAVERVRALLDDAALRDPNWNGATFRVERADFTCIPSDESCDAVVLLNRIRRAISGETDEA